ncbi:hypothetical protein ACIQNG_06720 [Streptomyces sp. NPDC091377]|uniref:hypothetical protein n=1 Tax=Streptomyces sp. NPDC091377 TaxID=3365995 RepID=UPI0037FFABD5
MSDTPAPWGLAHPARPAPPGEREPVERSGLWLPGWDAGAPAEPPAGAPAVRQAPPHSAGSWARIGLSPVPDGTYQPPRPTVGHRDDGAGLFYPGRVHRVASG